MVRCNTSFEIAVVGGEKHIQRGELFEVAMESDSSVQIKTADDSVYDIPHEAFDKMFDIC